MEVNKECHRTEGMKAISAWGSSQGRLLREDNALVKPFKEKLYVMMYLRRKTFVFLHELF